MILKEINEGLIIEVNVKPRSKDSKIKFIEDKVIFCSKKQPIRGKVNTELVKVISNLFGAKVRILSGFKSNNKILLLKKIDKNTFLNIIKNYDNSKVLPS